VNDTWKGTAKKSSASAPMKFSTWLGELKEGDTIYIAVGPDTHDGNDTFFLSFKLHK